MMDPRMTTGRAWPSEAALAAVRSRAAGLRDQAMQSIERSLRDVDVLVEDLAREVLTQSSLTLNFHPDRLLGGWTVGRGGLGRRGCLSQPIRDADLQRWADRVSGWRSGSVGACAVRRGLPCRGRHAEGSPEVRRAERDELPQRCLSALRLVPPAVDRWALRSRDSAVRRQRLRAGRGRDR
jgi:hypothetical protein